MPPQPEQFERAETSKSFDAQQFKSFVNLDVPDDTIKLLQASCGNNITQAVDKFHAMEGAKQTLSTSQVGKQAKEGGETNEMGSYDRVSIHERDRYWDKQQRRWRSKTTVKSTAPKSEKRRVLVVTRFYTEKMLYSHTTIQVNGSFLRNALRNIFCGAVGFTLTDEETVELEEPHFFYWAKDELELLAEHYKLDRDSRSLFEIEAGLQFIHTEWAPTISALPSLLPSSITFDYLWTVFPPDCLMVGKDPVAGTSIWRARLAERRKTTEDGIFFGIDAEYVDWNGKTLGIMEQTFKIPLFAGTIVMAELPAVPLRYHPNKNSIVQRVLERSQKKLEYCIPGFQIRQHEGLGLTIRSMPKKDVAELHYFRGRIMVDPQMMHQVHPDGPLKLSLRKIRSATRVWFSELHELHEAADREEILEGILKDPTEATADLGRGIYDSDGRRIYYSDSESESDEPVIYGLPQEQDKAPPTSLTREEMLLLGGRLLGYCLNDTKWGAFSVDHVSEVNWNNTVFDSLVMDQSLKDIIFRLIKSHGHHPPSFDDFVKGKGKGLIGLLLGPPGSGKTLTAEVIAETAHMPLFIISSGALGSEPANIHKNLTMILELAAHWRAVLLLDEADVFLAQRKMNDLKRNAIVAIFLRELEYYQGVLILTTNEGHIIDAAFNSRIHFCNQYKSLDFAARKKVWLNFMEKAQRGAQGIKVDLSEDGIEQLAKMAMNGRQIKNAMSIAMNLAMTDKARTISAKGIIATTETLQNFDLDSESPSPIRRESLTHHTRPSQSSLLDVIPTIQKRSPPPPPPKRFESRIPPRVTQDSKIEQL